LSDLMVLALEPIESNFMVFPFLVDSLFYGYHYTWFFGNVNH